MHVAFALLVAAAHIALVIAVAAPLSGEPLVPSMFWMQMRGRLHMQILIYCAIVVTGLAMTIHAKYRDRQLAAVRLEAQLAEARLDALRTHLQPHFLFNSLHSIAWLARSGDNAGVVRLVAALSDLLRSVLDASTRRVPLRDELLLVERYLEIQRVRFADRLTTKFEIAADTNEVPVPPLVVQPLVENALRHGLTPRPGPGTLLVRAFRDDGLLVVVVEDDGSGLPGGFALESCIGTGLRNLASRLAAEYGPRQSVGIEPRAGGGVRATLRVPFETV